MTAAWQQLCRLWAEWRSRQRDDELMGWIERTWLR